MMGMISTLCPMDRLWRRWALFSDVNGRLDPKSQTRVTLARGAPRVRRIDVLNVHWEVAQDDESMMPVDAGAEQGLDVGTARHTHGDVVVAGHSVHMDIVRTTIKSPASPFEIFVSTPTAS